MDNNEVGNSKSSEIDVLVSQFKKLNEVTSRKQSLEYILEQLTFCNNIATLSKNEILFSSKVLMVSAKIMCNSTGPHSGATQTLVLTIKNVSDSFTFDCRSWQIHIGLNGRTQGSWTLENPLCPNDSDTFCVPLTEGTFFFPSIKVNLSLHFAIDFELKTFAKSFEIMECDLDILDCLDVEKFIVDTAVYEFFKKRSFVDVSDEVHKTKVEFPPVTKFILRLHSSLKDRFLRDIFLVDSLHRGFESCLEELDEKSEVTVYFLGIQIDVNMSKSDMVIIRCSNPYVLTALKASILKRLVGVEGIFVEALDDKDKERLDSLDLKLQTLSIDNLHGLSRVSSDDLMELYLELRDIGESIRFSVVHSVD